ncbi:MAG: hypothetical protein J7480_06515 [Microbacteriaceae bacterium]|nr:hypothetical protein [Microbacteriaceae bacterium]
MYPTGSPIPVLVPGAGVLASTGTGSVIPMLIAAAVLVIGGAALLIRAAVLRARPVREGRVLR